MTNSVRRISVCLVGLASAAVLAAGCSSSSNGNPPAGFTNPGTTQNAPTGGNQGGGNQGGTTQQAPGVTPPQAGNAGNFCKDFKSIGNLKASDFTSPSKAKKVVAVWQRLAQEAPPQIKSDVQTIADFLQSVQNGHPDMSKIQKITQINEHIYTYIASHC